MIIEFNGSRVRLAGTDSDGKLWSGNRIKVAVAKVEAPLSRVRVEGIKSKVLWGKEKIHQDGAACDSGPHLAHIVRLARMEGEFWG